MIVSGGARTAETAREAYRKSGADAVMIARGSLGNPWIFAELTGDAAAPPGPAEIEAELLWVLDRAEQHWGAERAARNLRKFYPWYVERLGLAGAEADRFQRTQSLDQVRELLSQAVARGRDRPRIRIAIIARCPSPCAPQIAAFRAFLCQESRHHAALTGMRKRTRRGS